MIECNDYINDDINDAKDTLNEESDEESGEESSSEESDEEEPVIEEIIKPSEKSKSSSRRSESVLNKNDKSQKIDELLKQKTVEYEASTDTAKTFVIKDKKQVDVISPYCVNTKHSVNKLSKTIETYYNNINNGIQNPSNFKGTEVKKTVAYDVDALKEIINIFLDLDKQVSLLSAEIKEYRTEKKQYEEYILDFMEEYNEEKLTHKETMLRREVKEVRPKPKEDDMLQTLIAVLQDESVASAIVKKIFESVPLEEKIALKQDKLGGKVKQPKKIKRK